MKLIIYIYYGFGGIQCYEMPIEEKQKKNWMNQN